MYPHILGSSSKHPPSPTSRQEYTPEELHELQKKYGEREKVDWVPDYRYYHRFEAVMNALWFEETEEAHVIDEDTEEWDSTNTLLFSKPITTSSWSDKTLFIMLKKSSLRWGYDVTLYADNPDQELFDSHDAKMGEILGRINLYQLCIAEWKSDTNHFENKDEKQTEIYQKVAWLLNKYPELTRSLPQAYHHSEDQPSHQLFDNLRQ